MGDCICTHKPTHIRIIIPTLEVVHSDLFVEIVPSIAERVNGSNAASRVVLHNGRYAPGIVGVSADDFTALIGDGDNIALQILLEIVGLAVVDDTADRVLIVIQRNQDILISLRSLVIVPGLTQDLGAIQDVIMLDTCDRLAGTDTVGVVGVGVAVKLLQLAAFFPSQGVTEVRNEVALLTPVYNYFSGMSILEKQPHPERCGCPGNKYNRTIRLFTHRENYLVILLIIPQKFIVVIPA